METPHQFTDKQVSAILRRAAELQATGSAAELGGGAGAGFSLAQLQQAAGELGIDPRWVAQAAEELESDSQVEPRGSIWGGPWTVEIERTVPGVMTEEQWPEVLEAMRSATRMVGESTQVGRQAQASHAEIQEPTQQVLGGQT